MHLLPFVVFSSLAIVRASVLSVSLSVPSSSSASFPAGSSVSISYNVSFNDGTDVSSIRLVPYYNGAQFGAEVGLTWANAASGIGGGSAFIPLSWTAAPATRTLQLSWQGPFWDGPTMGDAPPANAVLSNGVSLSVEARAPVRPHTPAPGEPLLTLYWEPWFTPLNFYWQEYPGGAHGAGLAEAIPAIGRYASVTVEAIRHHAAQFTQAGVDALVIDWTNNAWGLPTWEERNPNVQELCNATSLTLGVYAGLRANEGWDVPRFILLLGLDNGPTTPLPALQGELDYIVSAYLANSSVGADSFVFLQGLPLVIIFDGTGADHSNYSHANFTIRWMASQLQSTPDFARRGYWSWMDGTLEPLITLSPGPERAGTNEAATLAPAFFATGGWLNSQEAVGRSGGLSLLAELSYVLGATNTSGLPSFLNVCQWNEFAGTPEGQASTYADSYSPDLSNDLEPTSPWGCAYQRPGDIRCGGGWGYMGLNALALTRALLADATVADGSAALFIITPQVGTLFHASTSTTISWVAAQFNSAGLSEGGLLRNVSLPVAIALDGVTVATLPAPSSPGMQTYNLNVDALDPAFPHVLTIAATAAPGGAHLTRWPLSFDTIDADGAGVPLAQPVAAVATAWIWLPGSQARTIANARGALDKKG